MSRHGWHIDTVEVSRGWRDIGDTARFTLTLGDLTMSADVSRVTDVHFIEGERRIPPPTSSTELFLTLHLNPLRPVLEDWFRQRSDLFQELKDKVSQRHWGRGKETPVTSYAALAHLYALLVAEHVHDPISELRDLMNTPTREAAAMRIKTIRDKGFLTSPSRGVVAGDATELSQEVLVCDWISKYYR